MYFPAFIFIAVEQQHVGNTTSSQYPSMLVFRSRAVKLWTWLCTVHGGFKLSHDNRYAWTWQ